MIINGVPRFYEKVRERVYDTVRSSPPLRRAVFGWGMACLHARARARLAHRPVPAWTALQAALADRIVAATIRKRVGGRLRLCISGGAPIARDVIEFFFAIGIPILEGYGLTETSPVICLNAPGHARPGSVGPPVPGVEVKIGEQGEILTRGPHVMKGYYNRPDATAEAIDAEGWFHTGDIGVLEDGFLRITDRKKDIIVTAGGKNIAPQPIENRVKMNKFVSQAVMIGDKRKFPAILVVPNWENLEKWAAAANVTWTDRAQAIALPAVRTKMEQEVEGACAGLAHFEMPKKVALLEHDFSIERGELTPKLSVKRRVIDQTYKPLIDALYAGD